eukprot:s184_g10.t1
MAYHRDDFQNFVEAGHFIATENTYHQFALMPVGHCVPGLATGLLLQGSNIHDGVGYWCRGKWYEAYIGLKIQQFMQPFLTDAEKDSRRWHVHVLECFIWHLKLSLMYSEVNASELHLLMDSTWDEISNYEALEKISQTHWAAPQYFIMAGAGPFEGAVIAQDRGTGKSLVDTPDIQHISKEAGVWNLVQTNDDSNKAADDPRRPLAQMMLRRQHQEDVSTSFMWRDIVAPELRTGMTVFTWVGVPMLGGTGGFLRCVGFASRIWTLVDSVICYDMKS